MKINNINNQSLSANKKFKSIRQKDLNLMLQMIKRAAVTPNNVKQIVLAAAKL